MARWSPKDGEGVSSSGEIVSWSMEQQWLLGGDLEVILWCSIKAGAKTYTSEWASVIIISQKMDEALVSVTLSEAMQLAEDGDYRKAGDLLDLIATM